MSDFAASWNLCRGRLVDSLSDLSDRQLNWRLHPQALTIGEMAIHVAGVELFFARQLLDLSLDGFAKRVEQASTDGVVNDKPFPFAPEEITPELVARALAEGKSVAGDLLARNTDEVRAKSLVSALGPVIDGTGAMARLAFHPGYHQGQVWLIRTAPGFPQE
ncbi:MAG: DinB family protein [Fimbriimonadaceae bacterium]|nr:DinB family protein [Fimbriimonadaceae bacterium]